MDAESRLKLQQIRNRGEACDRLLESLEPGLAPQFAQGYGADGYVVRGLDGSVKTARYQSNTAVAVGRAISASERGSLLFTDQQSRAAVAPTEGLGRLQPALLLSVPRYWLIALGFSFEETDPVIDTDIEQSWFASDLMPGSSSSLANLIALYYSNNQRFYALQLLPRRREINVFVYNPTTGINVSDAFIFFAMHTLQGDLNVNATATLVQGGPFLPTATAQTHPINLWKGYGRGNVIAATGGEGNALVIPYGQTQSSTAEPLRVLPHSGSISAELVRLHLLAGIVSLENNAAYASLRIKLSEPFAIERA